MIVGTFSKSLGCVGGYAVSRKHDLAQLRAASGQGYALIDGAVARVPVHTPGGDTNALLGDIKK